MLCQPPEREPGLATMLRILRRAAWRTTPWKNGGGITHEVLRFPEADPFEWRVSVAQIEKAGPFSDFPPYRRHMVLLQGEGVRLDVGGTEQRLERIGQLIEFDGAAAVDCRLLGGPCTDLNLMVARELTVRAAVRPVEAAAAISAASGESLLLFNLAAPLRVAAGDDISTLGTWDAALLEGEQGHLLPPAGARGDAPNVVFFATICHGRKS